MENTMKISPLLKRPSTLVLNNSSESIDTNNTFSTNEKIEILKKRQLLLKNELSKQSSKSYLTRGSQDPFFTTTSQSPMVPLPYSSTPVDLNSPYTASSYTCNDTFSSITTLCTPVKLCDTLNTPVRKSINANTDVISSNTYKIMALPQTSQPTNNLSINRATPKQNKIIKQIVIGKALSEESKFRTKVIDLSATETLNKTLKPNLLAPISKMVDACQTNNPISTTIRNSNFTKIHQTLSNSITHKMSNGYAISSSVTSALIGVKSNTNKKKLSLTETCLSPGKNANVGKTISVKTSVFGDVSPNKNAKLKLAIGDTEKLDRTLSIAKTTSVQTITVSAALSQRKTTESDNSSLKQIPSELSLQQNTAKTKLSIGQLHQNTNDIRTSFNVPLPTQKSQSILKNSLSEKTNQPVSVTASQASPIVYGQLGFLSAVKGTKSSQTVLFIQNQSTKSQKEAQPQVTSNSTTGLNTQSNQFIQIIPVSLPQTGNQSRPLNQYIPVTLSQTLLNNTVSKSSPQVIQKVMMLNMKSPVTSKQVLLAFNTAVTSTAVSNSLSIHRTVASSLSNSNILSPSKSIVNTPIIGVNNAPVFPATNSTLINAVRSSTSTCTFSNAKKKITSYSVTTPVFKTLDTTSSPLGNISLAIKNSKVVKSNVGKTARRRTKNTWMPVNSVSNETPCSQKCILPVNNSNGCARTNGLKPYQRMDTFICKDSLISPNSNKDGTQFPVIAGYKSLAVSSQNENVVTSLSLSFSASRIEHVNTTPAFPVAGIKNNKLGDDWKKNNSYSVIDLTADDSPSEEEEKIKEPKDTVGIMRTGMETKKSIVNKIMKTSPAKRKNNFSEGNTEQHTAKKLKRPNVIAGLKMYNSSSQVPTYRLDNISRTLFALDRLARNHKYYSTVGKKILCIDNLREFRDVLIIERNKQKLFMDVNLEKSKQEAQNASDGTQYKSPAERLMEKFSLKKITSYDLKKEISTNSRVKEKPKTFQEILEQQRYRKKMKEKLCSPSALSVSSSSLQSSPAPSPIKPLTPSPQPPHLEKLQVKSSSEEVKKIQNKPCEKKEKLKEKNILTKSKSGSFVSSRSRNVIRSNPKDPINSSEDRALQRALALSLKSALREKRKIEKEQIKQEDIEKSVKKPIDNKRKNISQKKKRPTEIDQLMDTHWNESWLKDALSPTSNSSSNADKSPMSIREERKLHYAMSRFAEMEQDKENALLSPTQVERHNGKSKIKKEIEQNVPKNNQKLKLTNVKTTDTERRERQLLKIKKFNFKRKKNELVKKAKRHIAKVQSRSDILTASVVLEKLPLSSKLSKARSKSEPQSVAVQKKEYFLVPMYHGFKDFAPVVVNSRTRRQATTEDRNKLKKHEFPLMVVEKVGNETKEVIVQEGENKEEKLAEASNSSKKEFELSSSYKRYLNVNRNTGETILHKAARLGYAELAEITIINGGDVHARDNAGWSALHEACAYGKIDVVRVLLKYGADANSSSNSGIRPLHDAVEKGNFEVIRLLLSYGADQFIASYTGALPSDCTRNEKVKKLLKDYAIDQRVCYEEAIDREGRWDFSGSCRLLDTVDCSDIFSDIPIVEKLPYFEFDISNRPMLQSYYLPFTNDNNIIVGYRNYYMLTDLLERVNLSRNALFKHYKVELRKMTWSEFVEYIQEDVLAHIPNTPAACSSNTKDIVELVSIGPYTLRKMMNLKLARIDSS